MRIVTLCREGDAIFKLIISGYMLFALMSVLWKSFIVVWIILFLFMPTWSML